MSHARVAVYTFRSGSVDGHIAKGRAELPSLMLAQPGVIRYGVLRSGPDTLVSLSLFDSAEHAVAASKVMLTWVDRNIRGDIQDVQSMMGDVVVSDQATPPVSASYGRVALYSGANAAEAGRRAQESLIPQLRALEGYVRYTLVDTGSGTGVVYSGWQTRAQAEASAEISAAWRKEQGITSVLTATHIGEFLWTAAP
jgi:hypothetical protein